MNIDPSQFLTPKKGMTSVEAAQQFLKEEQRQLAEQAQTFDMDALEKSALVRHVGFPFAMTVERNRAIFTDHTTGLKTSCMFTQPLDLKAGKRMFRALTRLKTLHDDVKENV